MRTWIAVGVAAFTTVACGGAAGPAAPPGGTPPSRQPSTSAPPSEALPTAQAYRSEPETFTCEEVPGAPTTPDEFREWWNTTAPLPHQCPAVAVDGSRLLVGVSGGGCLTFSHVDVEEGAQRVTVTAVIEDASPVHDRTVQGGETMHWACTSDLQLGVEELELDAPLGDRELVRQARWVPPR